MWDLPFSTLRDVDDLIFVISIEAGADREPHGSAQATDIFYCACDAVNCLLVAPGMALRHFAGLPPNPRRPSRN
jgi:hypothetical protein